MVAVQQNITYKRELLAGDTVIVRSRILEISDKKIRFVHEMAVSEDAEAAAISELTGVHLDRSIRKSCPFPPDVLDRAQTMMQGSQ